MWFYSLERPSKEEPGLPRKLILQRRQRTYRISYDHGDEADTPHTALLRKRKLDDAPRQPAKIRKAAKTCVHDESAAPKPSSTPVQRKQETPATQEVHRANPDMSSPGVCLFTLSGQDYTMSSTTNGSISVVHFQSCSPLAYINPRMPCLNTTTCV